MIVEKRRNIYVKNRRNEIQRYSLEFYVINVSFTSVAAIFLFINVL